MPGEPVKVLVTIPIGEELLGKIREVSPRVEVAEAVGLGSSEHGEGIFDKESDSLLKEAEVIYGFGLPTYVFARTPRLKWVQVTSAGVDGFLTDEMRASSVVFTTVSGIHATPIGEFVLQLMLMFSKQAPLCFQLKQQKQWQRLGVTVLRSKTVGIVGLGHIGKEVARLAKAFGMRVMATERSVRRPKSARYVDALLPPAELPKLLSESDYVVICVPLTAETKGLIGDRELRLMKPSAYIINVARGKVIDEDALVRALEEKRIAGAGLDVFSTEPLPPESRLWDLDNVILSPHISGSMEDYFERATAVFCRNLRNYIDGRKLVNVVGKERGY